MLDKWIENNVLGLGPAADTIIVDLDSTVADTRHRSHMTPHNNPASSWDSYSMYCGDDVPIRGTIKMVNLLFRHHRVRIISGRSIHAAEVTKAWLEEHRMRWDFMRLRHEDDPENPVEYKRAVLDELNGENIVLGVEDWPAVVEMWESRDIPTVCINPRYQDNPNAYFMPKADSIPGG